MFVYGGLAAVEGFVEVDEEGGGNGGGGLVFV
jgi:hypothetical protein